MPIEVIMRADTLAADYAAWLLAHWSRTAVLDLLVLNTKITTIGGAGTRGEYLVSLNDEPQEIEGMIYSTFALRPTLTTNGVPKYAVVGAGPVVAFTAITY
jgi:hypothetical protein